MKRELTDEETAAMNAEYDKVYPPDTYTRDHKHEAQAWLDGYKAALLSLPPAAVIEQMADGLRDVLSFGNFYPCDCTLQRTPCHYCDLEQRAWQALAAYNQSKPEQK